MQANSDLARGRTRRRLRHLAVAATASLVGAHQLLAAELGPAQDTGSSALACAAKRPEFKFNRWQEDWSVLGDKCLAREPFDSLKYISLADDPSYYLSLGAGLRERVEINNTALFGVDKTHPDSYLIQRAEVHADLHLGSGVQIFTQLLDASAMQKDSVSPVDETPLNVEQAFVAVTEKFDQGTLKWRVGRQQMGFDLQRFVAVRDGPNVRQSFDAIWMDWESGDWRTIGFASQPVQSRDTSAFDDISDRHLRFNGIRLERKNVGSGELSAYYAQFDRDRAVFLNASGAERRDVLDLHYNGKASGFDWDVEFMGQGGHVGSKSISAWAIGSLLGYSLAGYPWHPHLGLQFDVATGDRHPDDGQLGTFNPLFPNGYYFTLASYSGDTNIIHLKPSVTFNPTSAVTLLGAVGFQWRETTADAVYAQGMQVVPNTAGRGDSWTGMYAQVRVDDKISSNLVSSIEAVHFQVGDAIRQAGGHDSNYLGIELKFCW
jgi:hypothetical protein